MFITTHGRRQTVSKGIACPQTHVFIRFWQDIVEPMMRNIFKFKRVNPAPGKKSDRIILILCFSVLALLVARNLLVFFKPSPATITKKPPEKIATVHEPRYKIKTPA